MAHSVVDILVANTADVLAESGELGGPAEEDESLVDGVGGEVVDEAVGVEGQVLPRALQLQPEAIKAVTRNKNSEFRRAAHKRGRRMDAPGLELIQGPEGLRVVGGEVEEFFEGKEV